MRSGTRFIDDLRMQMVHTVNTSRDKDTVAKYRVFHAMMDDPNTKRMLFDARQAALFDGLEEGPPDTIFDKLRSPFKVFYMEFTEPLMLAAQEPGQSDRLLAMLFEENAADVKLRSPETSELISLPASSAVFFLRGADGSYVTRAFKLIVPMGMALTWIDDAREMGSTFPDGAEWKEGYHLATCKIQGCHDREIGWWERAIASYTDLILWILSYMMAKSIIIIAEPMSRQQRRWFERKGRIPKPWHLVQVEPKFYMRSGMAENEPAWTHRYRYDVIGHLRFGKHKRGDGTYSETIEWIAPHQRGLANDVYIPKTYAVDRGKVVSQRMKAYWGDAKLDE